MFKRLTLISILFFQSTNFLGAQTVEPLEPLKSYSLYKGLLITDENKNLTLIWNTGTNIVNLSSGYVGQCSGKPEYLFPGEINEAFDSRFNFSIQFSPLPGAVNPEICEKFDKLMVVKSPSNTEEVSILALMSDQVIAIGAIADTGKGQQKDVGSSSPQDRTWREEKLASLSDQTVLKGVNSFFGKFDTEVIRLTGFHRVDETTLNIYPVIKIRGQVLNAVVSAAFFEGKGWFILSARAGEYQFPDFIGIVAPTPF